MKRTHLGNRKDKSETNASAEGDFQPNSVAASRDDAPSHSFHFDIWFVFTLENWLLDFGRPIFGLYVSKLFPLSRPGFGDYCHMAYNIITALCLLQLMARSQRPVPKMLQHLLVTFFVMGASIHLVGDSVQHRLIHSGYLLHLSVRDNPIMKQLKPASLVESFELLDFYDEHLGHMMWYAPLFAAYLVYFYGSFGKSSSTGFGVWLLAIFGAGFEWYLVTEGQIFTIFILMFACMVPIVAFRAQQGLVMDPNAKFLFFRSALTLVLVAVWVAYLWNDETLRKKYPGWLYIPEPWAYVSLYWMH